MRQALNDKLFSVTRAILKTVSVVLTPIIYLKFNVEARFAGFENVHWQLYKIIQILSLYHNKRFPNLVCPKTYNDKIQWLKLFDQDKLIVECSDKIAMKEYVARKLGTKYVPKLYCQASSPYGIDLKELPKEFVLKTNHDSGTVFLVQDKEQMDWDKIFQKIESSLRKTYGWTNGEWAYSMIEPLVFAEEYLGETKSVPPPDFKFHCSNGEVLWLQYISDRGQDTKEVIVSPSGEILDTHFDHNMKRGKFFPLPNSYELMKNVAEVLSIGFKYVRIDEYLIDDRIYVGEMTFYPLMGCYKGKGQRDLGKLLEFETKTRKKAVYSESRLYR